jgi:hypothetical protein
MLEFECTADDDAMIPRAEREAATLRAVAFHEAGHAVAAVTLGIRVFLATVVPSHDCAGHVLHAPIGELTVEQALLITLSGPAAQRRYFPLLAVFGPEGEGDLEDHIGVFDFAEARTLLRMLHGSDWMDVCAETLPRWLARADRLVGREWLWILRVAAALEQRHTLTGAEITTLKYAR